MKNQLSNLILSLAIIIAMLVQVNPEIALAKDVYTENNKEYERMIEDLMRFNETMNPKKEEELVFAPFAEDGAVVVIKEQINKEYYCNTYAVNIRQMPSITSEKIGIVYFNEAVEVLENHDLWYKVRYEDVIGYAYKEYLTDTKVIVEEESCSYDDLYLLAHVITGEAQCCNDTEQLYVASVVLNRVASPEFPNTISDVIYQPGQYTCVVDGNFYREPTEANWRNALYILNNGSILPSNVIYQSGSPLGSVYIQTSEHYYCY